MDVTVQEQVGKELTVLIEGADSYDSVLDAFYVGLRADRPHSKGPSVGVSSRIYAQADGSFVLLCYLQPGVTAVEVVTELKFQLKYFARAAS
jgi:hypothetical protein